MNIFSSDRISTLKNMIRFQTEHVEDLQTLTPYLKEEQNIDLYLWCHKTAKLALDELGRLKDELKIERKKKRKNK